MGSQDWDKELSFPYHFCQNYSSVCQVKAPPGFAIYADYCNLFCMDMQFHSKVLSIWIYSKPLNPI